MWDLSTLKVLNDPEKYAKTAKQKQAVKEFRERIGQTLKHNRPKNVD